MDQGLSPTVFDEQLGTWEYIGYFVQGFLCGDITWEWIGCGENDQVVRLIGYVIGSFIPFIDIRDVLAGLIKTDWVGAAFSLAGLIPAVGDAASVVAKIGKFLSKFPAKLAPVMRWVANSDVLGDTVKTTVFRVLLPGFSTLENAGFTPQTLARIMQHQKIDDLVAALGSGLRVTGARAVPMPWAVRNGRVPASRVAEEAVQNLVVRGQLDNAWTAVRGTTTNAWHNVPGSNRRWREDDIRWGPGNRNAIEVKAGPVTRHNRSSDLCDQARKDRELLDNGALDEKVWHFVPAQVFKQGGAEFWGVGPDAAALACLEQYGIPFVIHAAS